MASAKGSSNFRNMIHSGKNSLLPPKIPFLSISPSYADYGLNSGAGSIASLPKESNICHQRTHSENLILEEQPSWLDELLNEPETPVRRGHRRSSSDSFAYVDVATLSSIDYIPISQHDNKFSPKVPNSLWGSRNFDHFSDPHHGSHFADMFSGTKSMNRTWEAPLSSTNHLNNLVSLTVNGMPKNAESSPARRKPDQVSEKQDRGESSDPKSSAEKKEDSNGNSTSSETDTRRAKQKFAQRSRVRKLQYIAELERNVQALQVEGSEVAAELEFLKQQNLILSMENKALKQRLESIAQEQLIKYLEHEVLEREVGRLRSMYQLQQQPQQNQRQSPAHKRVNSRDLDSHFANLSLKHKDPTPDADAISGPLRI